MYSPAQEKAEGLAKEEDRCTGAGTGMAGVNRTESVAFNPQSKVSKSTVSFNHVTVYRYWRVSRLRAAYGAVLVVCFLCLPLSNQYPGIHSEQVSSQGCILNRQF